jgi:PAS domain S-box-containing protein
MKFSTRLSIAMVALALFTTAAVSVALLSTTLPNAVFAPAAYAVRYSIMLASALAIIVAIGLAVWLSRSLTSSLSQMTVALEQFGRGDRVAAPVSASGEVGLLARAFERMEGEFKSGSAKIKEYARRERFYIAAVESSNYAFVTVDPDGTITGWNPGAERLFGHGADEAIGQPLSLIIPEDKRDEARTNREKINRLEPVANLETIRVTRDGRRISVVIDGSPIKSRSGKVLGSSIIIRDVTEQKLAQDMFGLAVEACPSGMIMLDRSGRIVMVNTETERLFGYARAELINKPIELLVPEKMRDQHARHRKEFAAAPEARRMGTNRDLFGRRKDGTEFSVEVGLNPIPIRDGMLVLSVIVDISERRRNERLKDEFVSTVSHELRTPLTSIAGSLGLLTGGAAGQMAEPTMRLLKIAHKNSERLVRLINDILDIEKIESGKLVFDLKRVEMRALAEQAIDANRGFAQNFGVRIALDQAAASAFVRADPDRLVQVITNLLSNAIKFSPRGEEVLVGIEKGPRDVRLTVRDHGLGIPEEFKARIFEKFAQADATDARQKGGTGLGLSIVKQIVTHLGGTVSFEGAADGGTIFQVDLPRWELTSSADTVPDADTAPNVARARVLICDDDADVARILTERLALTGFAADTALSAGDALELALANHYDAILVDLRLPDRDGISLIQDLRGDPLHQNTPIVVISAEAARMRDDLRSASLDVLDWLNKPINTAQLVAVLERPLARNGTKHPRILHIDDDANVLGFVAEAIGGSCEVKSVASIPDAQAALAEQNFDLVVLDLMLSQSSGLDLLPELRDRDGNAMPVILYSARAANGHNAEQVRAALNKSHTSIDHVIFTLRRHMNGRLAPAQQTREVA